MASNVTRESTLILQQEVVPLSIGLLISVMNMLAIVILFRCRRMRYQIRLMSTNLAATDLLTGLTILLDSMLSPVLPEGLCRTLLYMYSVSVIVSFQTITGMLCDRFLALYFPFKYDYYFTREKWNGLVVSIWVLGILLAIINYHDGFGIFQNRDAAICINAVMVGKTGLTIVTLIFCVSIIVDIFLYLFMFIKLHQMSRATKNSAYQCGSFRSQATVLIKLSAIIGSFMVLYLPQILLNVVGLLTTSPSTQKTILTVQSFTGFFILLNSFLNPFLYVWNYTECRYTFLTLVCYCNKKRRDQYKNQKKQFFVSFLQLTRSNET